MYSVSGSYIFGFTKDNIMGVDLLISRKKQVRKILKQKKLDALIVTSKSNVNYLSCFTGDDSWLIVTGKKIYLLTDSRYAEQAQGQCSEIDIIDRDTSLSEVAARIINRSTSIKSVGLESMSSIAAFLRIKNYLKPKIAVCNGIIENVRVVKDDFEMSCIRKAGRIASEALQKTLKIIKPGITESHLAGDLEYQMRLLGGEKSFDTIVAFGKNGSRPHHEPGDSKLKKNDSILIDLGAKYKGYCSDITRCFGVGKVSNQYRKAYEAVRKAQQIAIENVRSQAKISVIDDIARNIISSAGFEVYGHGTGHGLGLEVHESPVVSGLSNDKLQKGNVITIEPGVYIPGKFGIRIEDDIFVDEKKAKILTRSVFGTELQILKI